MRAVVFDKKLSFEPDYREPTAGDGDCLIRVKLAGICATDLEIMKVYLGFCGILGHELVGVVESGSSEWRGRRVVCEINCVCRRCDMCQRGLATHCRKRTVLGIDGRDGCFADLVAVPETNLHEVPDALSDEEAVFVEPLAAAYQVLAQCPIESRMTVSVIGSGRLGLLVAQVLATKGCRLTLIGRNEKTLLHGEKKGIQSVHVRDLVAEHDRDVIVECTGSPEGLSLALTMIRPRGTIVLKSTCAGAAALNLAPLVVNEVTLLGSRCGPFPEAINALARQAVEVQALISRTFPIDEALAAFDAAADAQNVKILLRMSR